jgi:hypothetical protein
MEVYVRIRGHRRTGNPFEARDEARLAEQDGQHALEEMTANSPDMRLTKMSGDKYFGRILANVTLAEGSDPAHNLLSEGFAHE